MNYYCDFVYVYTGATGQNAPTTKTPPTKTPPLFSNVYKCLPAIRFCSNILFLFYYIFINLFIKIINLINDDCI